MSLQNKQTGKILSSYLRVFNNQEIEEKVSDTDSDKLHSSIH